MANSLLLHEGTGLGYARRLDIVDQAETNCFGPMDAGLLPNPHSPENFYALTRDFSDRLLPELRDADAVCLDVHSQEFSAELNLGERFSFLRAVAHCVAIKPAEVEPLADLLGVRAALLIPAASKQSADKLYQLKLVQERTVSYMPLSGEALARLALDVAVTTHDHFYPSSSSQKAV